MKISSMIAVYFVVWWITLFVTLPFGVKNAHEAGSAVEEGHDAGAPAQHMLLKKAGVTTVLAAVIFAGIYYAVTHGMLTG
jgi:predicted secreted protein